MTERPPRRADDANLDLASVRSALSGFEPSRLLSVPSQAAVTVVLHESSQQRALPDPTATQVLVIERAHRDGDPWSGHMAFPGGRRDPDDADLRATALRETREELGLDLSGAEPLGRLSDLEGRRAGSRQMMIGGFVYGLVGERPELELNHEVADALWVPLPDLLNPERYVDYRYAAASWRTWPGVTVGESGEDERVIWGLTFRFLINLFELLGQRFPVTP